MEVVFSLFALQAPLQDADAIEAATKPKVGYVFIFRVNRSSVIICSRVFHSEEREPFY